MVMEMEIEISRRAAVYFAASTLHVELPAGL